MKETQPLVFPKRQCGLPTATPSLRAPSAVISYVIWLWFRFSLSLRIVEEMLPSYGIKIVMKRCASGRLNSARSVAVFEPEETNGTS